MQHPQIDTLVNEGSKAFIVNPETATSLGPAISYAAAHHVKLISVDTIVGVGKVYMVVRASNLLYGLDACAYISSFAKSGYVLELEGDLTSSNGADRANAFNACMAANDPGVKVLKDPTVWTDATAATDAQNREPAGREQPSRPGRGPVRDQDRDDLHDQAGQWPAGHGHDHPRHECPAMGQCVRQRTRRSVQRLGLGWMTGNLAPAASAA